MILPKNRAYEREVINRNEALKAPIEELKKVDLDSIDFSEQFTVLSDNPTEAYYILSSNFMQRLLDYKKKTDLSITFSLREQTLYFKFWLDYVPFELDLLDEFENPEIIYKHALLFRNLTDMVKDLGINTHIWNTTE